MEIFLLRLLLRRVASLWGVNLVEQIHHLQLPIISALLVRFGVLLRLHSLLFLINELALILVYPVLPLIVVLLLHQSLLLIHVLLLLLFLLLIQILYLILVLVLILVALALAPAAILLLREAHPFDGILLHFVPLLSECFVIGHALIIQAAYLAEGIMFFFSANRAQTELHGLATHG